MDTNWPRITIVTPSFNAARYIEQTIQSVLLQGYPNLEYIVVDGGSTDGTLEIIRRYEKDLAWWSSESDRGMYDALNKGFGRTSGEIMGWISATDQLHVGGLKVVASVFQQFPSVEWITGLPTVFSEEGMTVSVGPLRQWSRLRFLAGANRYIQQESTLWRRSLWERAGGRMDDSRRNANDFELWVRYFRHARLYTVNALIGGFRMHSDSLGLQDLEACHRIHDAIIDAELARGPRSRSLAAFRKIDARMGTIPKLRWLWWRLVRLPLYTFPGPDWPGVIEFDDGKGWALRRRWR